MTPSPAAILTIVAVDLVAGAAIALAAIAVARRLWPRVEGGIAHLGHALGVVEDAGLSRTACERARQLFLAHLTPAQRRSWSLRRRVPIVTPSGRRYLLAPYRPYNVRAADALFCLQVEGAIPTHDKLLAQKLLLECDETRFLAHANVRTFSPAWHARVAAARRRCLD